jgi:hypothetical protein
MGESPRENCEILFVCCVSYTWIHRAGHALRCPCCVPVTGVRSPPSGTDLSGVSLADGSASNDQKGHKTRKTGKPDSPEKKLVEIQSHKFGFRKKWFYENSLDRFS